MSDFCDVRIAPLVSRRALENIKPYLTSLIIYRKHPPMKKGRIDWQAVSDQCGIEDEMTAVVKKKLQPGLQAIARWIDKERPKGDDRATWPRLAEKRVGASHTAARGSELSIR